MILPRFYIGNQPKRRREKNPVNCLQNPIPFSMAINFGWRLMFQRLHRQIEASRTRLESGLAVFFLTRAEPTYFSLSMAWRVSAARKCGPGRTQAAPKLAAASTPSTQPKQWYNGTGNAIRCTWNNMCLKRKTKPISIGQRCAATANGNAIRRTFHKEKETHFHRIFTGFLLGFTGFYWVLKGFIGFYWVPMGFTGYYWVLLGFTGYYWVLLGFNGFYWVFMGFPGFYWVLRGFTGF